MDWQPISTAPKDGTLILYATNAWVSCGRWASTPSGGEWREANNDWTDAWGGPDEPTHWRPLPPPPYATKADSDGDDGA